MRALKRGLFGTGLLTAGAYGGLYYSFPEVRENPQELLYAAQRSSRFVWSAARLAYLYKYSSLEGHDRDELGATILYNCLHKNGGLAIKLGQAIGTSQGLIPQEYIDKMSGFYQKARESSFEDVKLQIEEASGKKLEDLFLEFEPSPVSAASIAQVHIARLKNGQKVAVKVQHRWLKEQCYGDLKLVNLLTKCAEVVFPGFRYKWYGEELGKMLPRELDFRGEAKNADITRELFKGDSSIRVPQVYHSNSNDKVLIMEYMEGVAITKVKEIQEMGINLRDVSLLLNHCFSRQIFEFGHVHGDPHPGNLFITPQKDSSGKIKPVLTLLDHGLYQELTDDVKLHYSYLWKGILTRDEKLIQEAATKLGVGKFYQLLALMVSRKEFKDIMDTNEADYNKRLRLPNKEEQQAMVKQLNGDIIKEITILFDEMNKDILLLFKVNDFIRAITQRLGTPIKQYEIMAQYCFDAVQQKEIVAKTSFSKRFSFWLQRSTTLLAFKLYGFYDSIISFFRPPVIPDEQFIML